MVEVGNVVGSCATTKKSYDKMEGNIEFSTCERSKYIRNGDANCS